MHEIYTHADPHYTGRATVPVLWDTKTRFIVNNESADILRMLNGAFDEIVVSKLDLYPEVHRAEIDALNTTLYESLNNGVYRAGFASTQAAHDEAVAGVFATLEALEHRLCDGRPYLLGPALTESDLRLFVTLVRFDAAYHGLFKTNWQRVADYPFLQAYLERLMTLPGVAETVAVDHIKAGYYSIKGLNPSGIVPTGPTLRWAA